MSILEYLPIFKKVREKDKSAEGTKLKEQFPGEGFTDWFFQDASVINAYNSYVNVAFQEDRKRIAEYRAMSKHAEISTVLESICDEGTMEFLDGNVIKLQFIGDKYNPLNGKVQPKMQKEKERIQDEFEELFFNRVKVNKHIWDWFYTFLVDGRLFQELVINTNKPTDGIQWIKILPAETMIIKWNSLTGEVDKFYQMAAPPIQGANNTKTVGSSQAGTITNKSTEFDKDQINFIYYNKISSRNIIIGYLDKAIKPYRQLKLIEDSIVIYRIVRAPERLVFTIDVGGMTKSQAMAYIRKLQRQFSKKMNYDLSESRIKEDPNVISALENFWLPKTTEGRGPTVDVLQGGENLGEIRDLEYFVKKLYKALKYPLSRVGLENRSAGGGQAFYQSATEITKEEIFFAKFIERIQKKFAEALLNVFLIHLNLKGLKSSFGLTEKDLCIKFKEPSNYKELMDLQEEQKRAESYLMLATNEEFSKEWLMQRYLRLSDEEIKQMKQMKKVEDEENREEEEEEEEEKVGSEEETSTEFPTTTTSGSAGEEEPEESTDNYKKRLILEED